MQTTRVLLLSGLLALGGFSLLTATGCKTAEPGVTEEFGTVVAILKASPDTTSEAAKKALEDLQFQFVTARYSKIDGYITAKTAQNDNVTIRINDAGEGLSRVRVRVGTFGDEAISLRIIQGIRAGI